MEAVRRWSRIRSVSLGTGARLLSVGGDTSCGAALADALERVPHGADVVIDLDRLEGPAADEIARILRSAARVREAPRTVVVVCGRPDIRARLRVTGADRDVLVEHSLGDALRYILGRKWFAALADVAPAP
jgi:hypothetical protein